MSFGKKGHGFEEFLDIIEAQRFFTFLKTVDFLGFRTSDSGSRENRNLEQIVGGVITTNQMLQSNIADLDKTSLYKTARVECNSV